MNELLATIKKAVFVPIHPAGYPFIAIFAVIALILAQFGDISGMIGLILTLWCVFFFRSPVRATPVRDGLIISPADGMVSIITEAPLPPELDAGEEVRTRVSVFLNVFDVHVNRVPADGEVKKVVYRPGKFFNASLDKASVDNERSSVLMSLKDGRTIAFVQIAGLVARRIICKLKAGETVKAGNLYGLIRFGSRVDVFLPKGVAPLVSVGQRMIGGETVIADLNSAEPARITENRA